VGVAAVRKEAEGFANRGRPGSSRHMEWLRIANILLQVCCMAQGGCVRWTAGRIGSFR
jgi:hypothetical protein